ncbi:hypothetical protein TOL5_31220 [Acinetobacter sp. Tol 5]|nr:hypothetical protein TOL5_31220 [Acinetobacter sp. Tol 5]
MLYKFIKNGGGCSLLVLYFISEMLFTCFHYKECRARRTLNIYFNESFSYYFSLFVLFVGVIFSILMVINFFIKSLDSKDS